MLHVRTVLAACAALAMLAACGGGGGGGTTGTPAAATLAITPANQATVARAALGGGLAVAQTQANAAGNRVTAQSVAAAPAVASSMTGIQALRSVMRDAAAAMVPSRRTAASTTMRPAAANSQTSLCSGGGSFTTTVSDTDNNGVLSAGDALSITFSQCQSPAGDITNGTLAFSLDSVRVATASELDFSGSVSFQQMSVTIATTTTNIDGSVSVALFDTSAETKLTMTTGATGFGISITSPSFSDAVYYDAGMRIVTDDTATQQTSSFDGSFSIDSLNGRVVVSTLQTVVQPVGSAFPSAGQILVSGTGGSQLRLTVEDSTQVFVELDANGDGNFEATTTYPWGTLVAD